jgi:hypothetical protein
MLAGPGALKAAIPRVGVRLPVPKRLLPTGPRTTGARVTSAFRR